MFLLEFFNTATFKTTSVNLIIRIEAEEKIKSIALNSASKLISMI